MAYLRSWRERWRGARAGMALAGHAWRACRRRGQLLAEAGWALVPSPCPLCQDSARGGCLCEACRNDIVASRLALRCCERCGLARVGARHQPTRPPGGFDAGTVSTPGAHSERDGPSAVAHLFDGCPDCAALTPAFDRAVAAFDYAFPGNLLLRQFKRRHRFQHGRAMAALMEQAMAPVLPVWWPQAWLVPIPSSSQALRRRGFNPACELARRLQARLGARVRTDILLRRPDSGVLRTQKQLPRRQRLAAPGPAFVCRTPLAGAHVVLVDDVMTTGATLHGAAQVLRQAGAASVWCVVAARTPYHVR